MGPLFTAFISAFLISVSALAEYRVFTLKIEDSKTGASRVVNSTLDHIQYPAYHPVSSTEVISIQDTWMCHYYRSDISQDIEQKYCPNPKAPVAPSRKS